MVVRLVTVAVLLLPAFARAAEPADISPDGSPEWVRKNLENNDSPAVVALGINYLLGKGVMQDGRKAVTLFAGAVTVDDALAECYMGIAFADGNGVPKNGAKAMEWFTASARDGCAAAFDYLGHGYEAGLAGKRDLAKALEYYKQSASLGFSTAQWDAGVAYQEGRGTAKDLVEALKWFQLADQAGLRAAIPRRDEIQARLSPAQVDEARRRVLTFTPDTHASIALNDRPPATAALGDYFQAPVKVFGDTRQFIVDTGNYFTIFDETYSRRLPPLTSMPRDGAGAEVELRDCPELLIEGRSFSPLLAVVADVRQIQQASGEPLAGILGLSCFKHEVLVFDSDKGQVTFTGAVPENLKKKAIRVHIEKKNSSTYGVTAYINGVPVFLAMDTGDADCITLNDADIKRLFHGKPTSTRHDPVVGLDGKIFETQSFRLRTVSLSLGHNTCTNLIAHTSRSAQLPSRLGQGFIRRYLCAMDFPNRVLYLAPGSRFAVPDEFDMSGLSLLDIGGKVTVYSVEENSPALEAGVRADDQILSINGQKAASLRLKAIHEMLKTRPGEEIILETKRGGENRPVKFNLKRLL